MLFGRKEPNMNFVQHIIDLWSSGNRSDAAKELRFLASKDVPDDVVIEILDLAALEDDPEVVNRFVSGS